MTHSINDSQETLKARLYNQSLGVFGMAYHLDTLREAAIKHPLQFLYVHLPCIEIVEGGMGWEQADQLYHDSYTYLTRHLPGFLPGLLLIAPDSAASDSLIAVAALEDGNPLPDYLCEAVENGLSGHLRNLRTGSDATVLAGSASLNLRADVRFERHFWRAVHQARTHALAGGERRRIQTARQLTDIITRKQIRTLYQPIVRLGDQKIIGYEALSRGPQGTAMESPDTLFEIAAETGLTFELDQLCQRTALQISPSRLGGASLFLNASPLTFQHPKFNPATFINSVTGAGFEPEQIVIELTERSGIRDFPAFGRTMKSIKNAGFRLAVDDVGTGYSSLQTITETGPEFFKIDMSLVKGIDLTPIKQQIVRSLAHLGQASRINVIAEGVELPGELAELVKIDIELAQGYYFSHPAQLD